MWIANYILDNQWKLDTPAGKLSVTYLGSFIHPLACWLARCLKLATPSAKNQALGRRLPRR